MKIVLAGYGTMGKHYIDKLVRRANDWGVIIAGIVDTNPQALSQTPAGIAKFTDIRTALAAIQPDIVINTANNDAHIDVIRALEGAPSVKAYLTEKPLVGEAENFDEATRRLQNIFVSMDMITNFSEAAIGLKDWVGSNPQLKLVGIEGVWGKDRRADTRPTSGIVNDIVHPVGLIQSIFRAKDWEIIDRAYGTYGRLSTTRDGQNLSCVFQYAAEFKTSIAPVRLDCSFGWKEQARRVTAFFNSGNHHTAAELFLDAITTDADMRGDFFKIHDIDANGHVETVYQSPVSIKDKLESYLEKSLSAFRKNISATDAGLIGLTEEQTIGDVYKTLHPSDNKDVLLNTPHLFLLKGDVDSPLVSQIPEFANLSDDTDDVVRTRIGEFEKLAL